MTVPVHVLAAVRSIPHPAIPHPRQEPDMTMPLSEFTEAQAEHLAAIEAADPAPESNDDTVWAALSDLIPCNPYGDCGDECECAEGELRLAVTRLVMAERVHHEDCGDDADCCNRTVARARLVNKAAALAAPLAEQHTTDEQEQGR